MNYVGLKVNHPALYGEGIVLSQNDRDMLEIQFTADNSIKKFRAPGCFSSGGPLELYDETASSHVEMELEKEAEEQKQEEARRKREALFVTGNERNNQRTSGDDNVYIDPPRYYSVDEFVSAMQPVLQSEVYHLKTNNRQRTKLADGKLVKTVGDYYIYSFESETELSLPNNTEIVLWLPESKGSTIGYVIDSEDFNVIISTYQNLGKIVPQIEFTTDTWMLLEKLSDRLEDIRYQPSPIVNALVCDGQKQITPRKEIYTGQDTACQMSSSQPITFIWGPPGTGKTETLANIALSHMAEGHRVLMLSHSNVSVDGATWRVFNKDAKSKPGKIIRFGYPKDKALLSHEYLTSYNYVIRSHPDLMKSRERLFNERQKYPRESAKYVEIGKKLISIKNQLDGEEKRAVREALFVSTTVSKAVVDKTIFEDTYDVVIFDEASMAYIPQIVFSASLAKSHFICLGDFSQLPPIVQSDHAEILKCDIFQYCGIVQAVQRKACHEWLCLLDTQYRMHPAIAEFSSATMYQGLLKSGENMERQRQGIVDSEPFSNEVLLLVDLAGMYSLCKRSNDGSHINVLSAFISMGLAIKAATSHEVGIITPYKAQSRLLHAMAQDIKEKTSDYKDISCATVHQFQGSEKEVIIYDAVDCYVQSRAGVLLTGMKNNNANRLFNVAITRAKGKFIPVTHVGYMNTRLSNRLIFKQLIDKLVRTNRNIAGAELLQIVNSDVLRSYNEWFGSDAFLSDLKNATQSISITIPQTVSDDEEWIEKLAVALADAKQRQVRVIIQSNNKAALPAQIRTLAIASNNIFDPIAIIDKTITWYGMPRSAANYILNDVPQPTRYRPILRFEGRHFAQTLSALSG